MRLSKDYGIFKKFIERYIGQDFFNINRQDPFILEMESILSERKQFIYIADLIHMRVPFTSLGSINLIGIEAEKVEPGNIYQSTYPTDLGRMNIARQRVFKFSTDFFVQKKGDKYISIPFLSTDKYGKPLEILYQGYIFYSNVKRETVYALFILTDLSDFSIPKEIHHHYIGDDPAVFRYPDNELFKLGYTFSKREFEILTLLAKGMDSDKIAEKLFLSLNTVNTHRRNLLKKTNFSTTNELVFHLMEHGIL
jgi:DNA-binding CsgD family transcriptional regulator